MRRISTALAAAALLLLAGCGSAPAGIGILVSNPIGLDRQNETVFVSMSDLTAADPTLNSDNIVITDADGNEIPSQVIMSGGMPQSVAFQATVPSQGQTFYTVKAGEPAQYEPKVFGRYVPERKDDYSFENNVMAWRSYGKALEAETIAPGIDVWVKCSDKLVVNEWVANEQAEANWYHHNHGDGLDCYKVGVSMGGGSTVPYVNGSLLFPEHNWQDYEDLADGPIVKIFTLTYAPYDIDGRQVSLRKTYTVCANTNFVHVTDVYSGDAQEDITVAAGTVRHDVKAFSSGDNWYAFTEPASDSSQPEVDGDISLGMIVTGGDIQEVIEQGEGNHSLIVSKLTGDQTVMGSKVFTYCFGAGWSQGNVPDADKWSQMVQEQAQKLASPLEVSVY